MKTGSNIQYIPGNSIVYRLNPIVKGIICFLMILFFAMAKVDVYCMSGLLFFVFIAAVLLKIKQKNIWKSLAKISFLLILVGLLQGFSNNGLNGEYGFNLILAIFAVVRIIGVFVVSGLYLTISPQSELLFFGEKIFAPLKFFGLPADELALIMVIALRFFPVMLSEIDRIKMAQIARGAKFKKGGTIFSAVALMPLLIPTLSQALVRANDLSDAMEARGYRVSSYRTRYLVFSFGLFDFLFILTTILILFFLYTLGSA